MKVKLSHTLLNDEILKRYEAKHGAEYRPEIAHAIEYCAYVACMVYGDMPRRWKHFSELTRKYAPVVPAT